MSLAACFPRKYSKLPARCSASIRETSESDELAAARDSNPAFRAASAVTPPMQNAGIPAGWDPGGTERTAFSDVKTTAEYPEISILAATGTISSNGETRISTPARALAARNAAARSEDRSGLVKTIVGARPAGRLADSLLSMRADATRINMSVRPQFPAHHQLVAMGVESSCDDTAVAVLKHDPGDPARILSSIVLGQDNLHLRHGGVVPEVAARAHAVRLETATEAALAEAGVSLSEIDVVAVTAGPGLIGGLIAGIAFAQGVAIGSGKPLLGINHLAGHALTARLTHCIEYPYPALLASGGHCQFLAVLGADSFIRLGGTIDDAPGEAFDKSARLLGLGQPGGPAVEAAARSGNPDRFHFPRPLSGRQGCNMSFSGLKTALARACEHLKENGELARQDIADLCAGFQKAVSDVLAEKTATALEDFSGRVGTASDFAICGGVAANHEIRSALEAVCSRQSVRFIAPEPALCTDNGAMIAWAGIERIRAGIRDVSTIKARPRWPLDHVSSPILGHGKRGPKS